MISDVIGMLGLYEVAHLRVHGEDILTKALAFTTTHLKAMVESLGYHLAEQVAHALNRPIRKGMERLEARWYISVYQDEAFHDIEGGRSYMILLLLANLPLASLLQMVRGLRTSCLIILGRTIGDQDLLSSCSNIVFKHKICLLT